jgi:hypothetical protein
MKFSWMEKFKFVGLIFYDLNGDKMILFEIKYYSISQELSLRLPLSASTLYEALVQAHHFDTSDASEKFGVSMWISALTPSGFTTTVGELTIKNSQGTLPRLPLEGAWRKEISSLLGNLDPQYDGRYLRELHRHVLSQVMGTLTLTKGLDSRQASALLAVQARLDRLLSVHKAVAAGAPIEFSREIDSFLHELRYSCPSVPVEFKIN